MSGPEPKMSEEDMRFCDALLAAVAAAREAGVPGEEIVTSLVACAASEAAHDLALDEDTAVAVCEGAVQGMRAAADRMVAQRARKGRPS